MRSAIAMSLLLCALVMVPVTAEPSLRAMQSSEDDPKQPRAGEETNQTMRIYSDGADCWTHFNDNDTEGMGQNEDEPYLEEQVDNGVLEIDIWCAMDPDLKPSVLLKAENAFSGSISVELKGSWKNGEEACTGNNNGRCENLNISFYRGNTEFHREEITSVGDGNNNVQINIPTNEEYLEFDGSSDSPQIRFEMVIVGNYREGSWLEPPSGEEALFRLYLGNNSTVIWPIDPVSWEEGFTLEEDGVGQSDDTPGFTTVLAMAAVAAGAIAVKGRQEKSSE